MTNYLRYVILGPPGSGKGTISLRIVNQFNLKYLSCGDLLRSQIQRKTDAGQKASQFISGGELVPDDLVIKLTLDELGEQFSKSSWLLDGFPRTLTQAIALANFTPINKVLNLIVPDDEIINRIKGRLIHLPSGRIYNTAYRPPKLEGHDDVTGEKLVQRDDDKPEAVKNRLNTYANKVEPILNFFRKDNKLIEFTGLTSDEIWLQIKPWFHQNMH